MSVLLNIADAIVHAAMLAILLGATGAALLLLHEQASLIRKSLTTKEHRHHDPHA